MEMLSGRFLYVCCDGVGKTFRLKDMLCLLEFGFKKNIEILMFQGHISMYKK